MLKSQKSFKVKDLSIQSRSKITNKKIMKARMIQIMKHQEKNRRIVILLVEEKVKEIIN